LGDRGFRGFWRDREARRRRILGYLEEEQRSETVEGRRKPTGAKAFVALVFKSPENEIGHVETTVAVVS
jgi:hypothetical protein